MSTSALELMGQKSESKGKLVGVIQGNTMPRSLVGNGIRDGVRAVVRGKVIQNTVMVQWGDIEQGCMAAHMQVLPSATQEACWYQVITAWLLENTPTKQV